MADEPAKPKRRVNADQRRALAAAMVQKFVTDTGRTAHRGGFDPNDRRTDHEVQQRLKQMKPEDLDRLMRDDED